MDISIRLARLIARRNGLPEPPLETAEVDPFVELDMISNSIQINGQVSNEERIALESFLPPGLDYSKAGIALESIDKFKIGAVITLILGLIGGVIAFLTRSRSQPPEKKVEATKEIHDKVEKTVSEFEKQREDAANGMKDKEIILSQNLFAEAKHLFQLAGIEPDDYEKYLKSDEALVNYFLHTNDFSEALLKASFAPVNYKILVMKDYATEQSELVQLMAGFDQECQSRMEFIVRFCEDVSRIIRDPSEKEFNSKVTYNGDLSYIGRFLKIHGNAYGDEGLAIGFKNYVQGLFTPVPLPPGVEMDLNKYREHYTQLHQCHQSAARFKQTYSTHSSKPLGVLSALKKDIAEVARGVSDSAHRSGLANLMIDTKEVLAMTIAISQSVEIVYKSCDVYLNTLQRTEERYKAATRFIDRLTTIHAKTKDT